MATTEATPTFSNSEATDSEASSAWRGLAGFEEDQRDAVVAQQRAELVGVDGDVAALLQLVGVLRVLEAQPAEADAAVIDAVAVEVDDVIRLARVAGAVEFLAQGGQRGRAEHVERDQAAAALPSPRPAAARWRGGRCSRRPRPPAAR